jgi:protein disulfide isomerase
MPFNARCLLLGLLAALAAASQAEIQEKAEKKMKEQYEGVMANLKKVAEVLTTVEEADAFIASKPRAVIGFVNDFEDQNGNLFRVAVKKLRETEEEHKDLAAAITSSDEVAAHLKALKPDIIVVSSSDGPTSRLHEHAHFPDISIAGIEDIEKVNLLGKEASKLLIRNLQIALTPDVIEFNMESANVVFSHPVKNHTLLFLHKEAKENEELLAEYARNAKHFRGLALFLTVYHSEAMAAIFDHFGVKEETLPRLQLIKASEVAGGAVEKFEQPEGTLTTQVLSENIENFHGGLMHAKVKSQDAIDDSKDDIKTIVGDNFKERVRAGARDTLLMLYAPWCQHCKDMLPAYTELAQQWKDSSKLMVAYMDDTLNDVWGVDAEQYPTVLLFLGGQRDKPLLFKYDTVPGVRDFENFLAEYGIHHEGIHPPSSAKSEL